GAAAQHPDRLLGRLGLRPRPLGELGFELVELPGPLGASPRQHLDRVGGEVARRFAGLHQDQPLGGERARDLVAARERNAAVAPELVGGHRAAAEQAQVGAALVLVQVERAYVSHYSDYYSARLGVSSLWRPSSRGARPAVDRASRPGPRPLRAGCATMAST